MSERHDGTFDSVFGNGVTSNIVSGHNATSKNLFRQYTVNNTIFSGMFVSCTTNSVMFSPHAASILLFRRYTADNSLLVLV